MLRLFRYQPIGMLTAQKNLLPRIRRPIPSTARTQRFQVQNQDSLSRLEHPRVLRVFCQREVALLKIKCKFDTLSGVMAQENIQSIGLLKIDAELADWEILNGVKTEDWQRIRQIAMEVHLESDVAPISQFLSERGFSRVIGKKWRVGTNCVWAIK
jgi:hypothetical protein